MYITITAIAAFFSMLWGWRAGLFRMLLRLLALCLAYGLAIRGTPPTAEFLVQKGWLNGVLAMPLVAVALLLLGALLFGTAAKQIALAAPEEWRQGGKKTGALVGAVLGCGVGLLLAWGAGTLKEAWQWRTAQQAAAHVTPEQSPLDAALRRAAGNLMADGVEAVLGNSAAAPIAAQWVREPLSVGLALKHIAELPGLRSLVTDPKQYAVLLQGDARAVQRLPGFQALAADPQAMQLLQTLGLQGSSSQEQSAALATMLSKYTQRAELLRSTPEFQTLAADPVLAQRVQNGEWLGLLADPRVRRLVAAVNNGGADPVAALSATPSAPHGEQGGEPASTAQVKQPSAQDQLKFLYRWKDEKGRLHITEEKPPAGIKADVIQAE